MTADRQVAMPDISAVSGPAVLTHVISLVGWPQHVECFVLFFCTETRWVNSRADTVVRSNLGSNRDSLQTQRCYKKVCTVTG